MSTAAAMRMISGAERSSCAPVCEQQALTLMLVNFQTDTQYHCSRRSYPGRIGLGCRGDRIRNCVGPARSSPAAACRRNSCGCPSNITVIFIGPTLRSPAAECCQSRGCPSYSTDHCARSTLRSSAAECRRIGVECLRSSTCGGCGTRCRGICASSRYRRRTSSTELAVTLS